MAKTYYVDIPDWGSSYTHEWTNINVFDTRQEAIDYISKLIGPNEDGKIQLISEHEDYEEEG